MEPAVCPSDARRRAQRRAARWRAARRPGGFTLIELLITLGIILVLITAGVLGFRALESSASKRQTQTALASADGLVKGMNGVGAGNRIESTNFSPAPFYQSGEQALSPGDVRISKSGRLPLVLLVDASNPPTSVGLETKKPGDTNFARSGQSTRRLVQILQTAPQNKKAISSLSREYLLEPELGNPKVPFDPPVLCDGWGNPLILVPSGGLAGVKISSESDPTKTFVITSPSNRPFWASAGPDGDFTKGDDNLYSFDK